MAVLVRECRLWAKLGPRVWKCERLMGTMRFRNDALHSVIITRTSEKKLHICMG